MKFCSVFGLTLTVLASCAQADSIVAPPAVSDVFARANGVTSFLNGALGTHTVSAGQCIDNPGDLGITCGLTTMGTFGFFPPYVIGPGLLSSLGNASVNGNVTITSGPQFGVAVRADGSGRLQYYVGVLALPGAPVGVDVPITVGYSLDGHGHAIGGGFTSFAQIAVSVNGSNMGGAFTDFVIDASKSAVKPMVIDTDDGIPDLLLIDLQVSGGVAVGDSPTFPSAFGDFSATADPTFQIDPNFAYRDFFDLVYSPNLAPSAVPEPSSIGVVGIGVLGLLVYVRSTKHGRNSPPA